MLLTTGSILGADSWDQRSRELTGWETKQEIVVSESNKYSSKVRLRLLALMDNKTYRCKDRKAADKSDILHSVCRRQRSS